MIVSKIESTNEEDRGMDISWWAGYCALVFTIESLFLCFWHNSNNILMLKSSFLEQGGVREEGPRDFWGKK